MNGLKYRAPARTVKQSEESEAKNIKALDAPHYFSSDVRAAFVSK
jgi:hypothetical protein